MTKRFLPFFAFIASVTVLSLSAAETRTVQFATQGQVNQGTSTDTVVSPATLAGLTNSPTQTNIFQDIHYNGKITLNVLNHTTNLWAGPTNSITLSSNYQKFIASGDCNITNVGGQIAAKLTWASLTISNSSAAAITVRSTLSHLRLIGPTTSTALSVGAGKEGQLTYTSWDFHTTNLVTAAQQ